MTTTTTALPGLALLGLALPGVSSSGDPTLITVTNTLILPTGAPNVGVTVSAALVSASPWLSDGREISGFATAVTDDTGMWSMDLLSNSPGSYYVIRESMATRWNITVPSAGGPYKVEDILTP